MYSTPSLEPDSNNLIERIIFRSKVDNKSALNIIHYFKEHPGEVIRNSNQLANAMRYELKVETKPVDSDVIDPIAIPTVKPPAGSVSINGTIHDLSKSSGMTFYEFLLEEGVMQRAECGGDAICGECTVKGEGLIPALPDESDTIQSLHGSSKHSRLACQLSVADVDGLVLNILQGVN